MNSMIYNPMEEYDGKFKNLHLSRTEEYFDELVKKSEVNVEENRSTVHKYERFKEDQKKLKRKYNFWRFLRVLACITLLLIPLVILKITPKIQAMRQEIADADKRIADILALAYRQMEPLNALFGAEDSIKIIESTIPSLKFAPQFSPEQEENMRINFDFDTHTNDEQSTIDLLAGHYNENPFLFENKLIHEMGIEVYHGYKTISWTETQHGSDGKMRTVRRTQTLHASVTKPKPFYKNQILLNYCAQGGAELSFSRDATHLHKKSEGAIERYVKRGEKKLKRKTDEAIKNNDDFVSMSNSDFEVLFDALDRTDEVQFRTLFTPLAQTNMVDLLLSKTGYGDDFNFFKFGRTNKIISQHSQSRPITLSPSDYSSYSYDIIRESFINKNTEYFKDVYFDFAPLWAIPVYQERPVHSLDPIHDPVQEYSTREYEVLLNRATPSALTHPATKTQAILKPMFISSKDGVDRISVSAYSYDIIKRVDFIPVFGGDGHLHNVPVPWDEYIPLCETNSLSVAPSERGKGENILAERNNICIFK